MGQKFSFGFSDALLAEIAGVEQKQLHFDVEAIVRAYENIKPLAERLGVQPPRPSLPGFCYPHVASLGAKIIFESVEPRPLPMIHTPEDIDKLTEPEDYLAAPLIQQRLKLYQELKERCPSAVPTIGHGFEGPVTTAMLLMGQNFLTLPYDDPGRAHRLLQFCTQSALNYLKAICGYFGWTIKPGPNGFPDDFAGMFHPNVFKEFVVPYWEQVYQGLKATTRSLHSELLREEHLQYLKELNIEYYDPGGDQYLTPELLSKKCPCKFQVSIHAWEIHNLSADELEKKYRRLSEFGPEVISFCMYRLKDEPKIKRLLDVARALQV